MKVFACLAWLAALVLSGTARADPSLEGLRGCVSESSDAARLACYDKEMGRTTGGTFGMTPQLKREKEVKAGIKPPPPPPPETLSASVTKISERSNGRLVITLNNGQVWEQQEDTSFRVKVGDAVTFEPGMLGALWINEPAGRGRTRVKRIK